MPRFSALFQALQAIRLMRVTPNNGVTIANVRARFNGLIDFFPADDGYCGRSRRAWNNRREYPLDP
ncbi:MAG: hypothetical protein U0521_09045 [Anaerolineae bacterium]